MGFAHFLLRREGAWPDSEEGEPERGKLIPQIAFVLQRQS